MSTLVLTLDDGLVDNLSAAAAASHQALPEWAAEQLAKAAGVPKESPAAGNPAQEKMRAAIANLSGIWQDRGTTADLMALTRGDA